MFELFIILPIKKKSTGIISPKLGVKLNKLREMIHAFIDENQLVYQLWLSKYLIFFFVANRLGRVIFFITFFFVCFCVFHENNTQNRIFSSVKKKIKKMHILHIQTRRH